MAESSRSLRRASAPAFLTALCLLAACSGGGGARDSANSAGTMLDHPDPSVTRSLRFVVDPNSGGQAAALHMSGFYWGRLSDVYDLDENGERRLQHEDYVVGTDIVSDGSNLVLETNPVTSRQSVLILHTRGDEDGRYDEFFARLDKNLTAIADRGLGGTALFTMVPRNAVLVARFDDLLAPELVNTTSVQFYVGNPPTVPFEARILLDYNHGDLVPAEEGSPGVFRSTRILIDPTISELESFSTDPPMDPNGVGLPAASEVDQANVALRLPTEERLSIGVDDILRNLRGNALERTNNGTIDFGSPTVDLLRAMRSGGASEVTGDPFNGFLRDQEPPVVVGRQSIVLHELPVTDPDGDGPFDLVLPLIEFYSFTCEKTPAPGDVIEQSGFYAEVRRTPVPVDVGVYEDMPVRLLLGDPEAWMVSAVGTAQFHSAYDPADAFGKESCFVGIQPLPEGFPSEPGVGLSLHSEISVRFSEPMDPASLTAFDSLTLTRVAQPTDTTHYVIGSLHQSLGLAEFSFVPDLPLAHQNGQTESYWLTLTEGKRGPTDLAGNSLADPLPQVRVFIDPDQPSEDNGGRVSRFTSPDEQEPFGGDTGSLPEWSGQHLYDVEREVIRPRPLLRYEGIADRSTPILGLLSPFPPGVQTPLSSLGSKLQTVWRYADVGFSLTDITNVNIDVEGLSWSPVNTQVIADHYDEFEVRLCHSRRQPDEFVDGATNLPDFPNSGLNIHFTNNFLDEVNDPQQIVHPKHMGYTVDPSLSYVTSSGTTMVPWPLNESLPVSEYRTYTWRDTTLFERAAPDGGGVDLHQLWQVLGIGVQTLMPATYVSTIGLPLLIEVRCYPDVQAVGLNAHAILLGSLTSPQPNFRAFSTGGVDQSGNVVKRDPDTETVANGGFNPNSNPPGAPTIGADNSVYLGAMDLVSRVSRTISIWFTATGATDPEYQEPVLEPRDEDQPHGTGIELAFRGGIVIEPAAAREDAASLDLYGEFYDDPATDRWHPNPLMQLQDGGLWYDDIGRIDGAPYYQVRVTFLANIESGVTPELSALAIAWRN